MTTPTTGTTPAAELAPDGREDYSKIDPVDLLADFSVAAHRRLDIGQLTSNSGAARYWQDQYDKARDELIRRLRIVPAADPEDETIVGLTGLCGLCGRVGATIYRSTDGLWVCERHVAFIAAERETIARAYWNHGDDDLPAWEDLDEVAPETKSACFAVADAIIAALQQREGGE
jgi:hypothetical protein